MGSRLAPDRLDGDHELFEGVHLDFADEIIVINQLLHPFPFRERKIARPILRSPLFLSSQRFF